MYTIAMTLYPAKKVNTAIYELLVQTYHLPSIETLLVSIEETIDDWHVDAGTQVYFIDNLMEPNRRYIFQVRFATRPGAHEHTDCFVSVEAATKEVHSLSLRFPSRGDRHCSAKIIGWLKDIAKRGGAIGDVEIAGYGERDTLRYIREHSLSAFVWHEELQRYLHVTDKPEEVKETKKGMTHYKGEKK